MRRLAWQLAQVEAEGAGANRAAQAGRTYQPGQEAVGLLMMGERKRREEEEKQQTQKEQEKTLSGTRQWVPAALGEFNKERLQKRDERRAGIASLVPSPHEAPGRRAPS